VCVVKSAKKIEEIDVKTNDDRILQCCVQFSAKCTFGRLCWISVYYSRLLTCQVLLEIKCEISCVIIDVRYLAKTDYDGQDILTTNELTFIQIVSNKGMKLSTLGVRRSKFKVTRGRRETPFHEIYQELSHKL